MPAMTLNDGSMWEPTPEQITKWKALYPAIDVDQELNGMVGWLDSNPTKRKTKRGIARFCNNWLSRAQDKGGSPMAKAQTTGKIKTRDMTLEDELSHCFVDTPEIRAHFMEKFGQIFVNGQRITRDDR